MQALEENKENAKMFLQSIDRAKSEAIKEFAERLKEYACCGRIALEDINGLVKEMTQTRGSYEDTI